MKWIGQVVLCAALASVGCLSMPWLQKEQKPPPAKVQEAPPPRPVTLDSVNESNAAEQAQALREEIEYDRTHKPAPPRAKAPVGE